MNGYNTYNHDFDDPPAVYAGPEDFAIAVLVVDLYKPGSCKTLLFGSKSHKDSEVPTSFLPMAMVNIFIIYIIKKLYLYYKIKTQSVQ